MNREYSQTFNMSGDILYFDNEKTILLCRDSASKKNRWAKKIEDINSIIEIIEDPESYYIACYIDEKSGQFLAVSKENGATLWFIPGRSFLQQLFNGYIFLIFIDDQSRYFLIKVDKKTGKKIWYHDVNPDLQEYSIRKESMTLKYNSGLVEELFTKNGSIIARDRK